MPCTPPFYPSPGHENRVAHDASSICFYYLVCMGWICGVFTHSWIARAQVEGFANSHQKAFKTWDEMIAYWDQWCASHHGSRCPAIQPPPPGFSTTPGPGYPPGPPPCSPRSTAYVPQPAASCASSSSTPAAESTASSSSSASSSASVASSSTASATPRAASAPAVPSRAASEESYSSSSSFSSMSDTSFEEDDENDAGQTQTQTQSAPPTPKKEERRSPSLFAVTRVHLTPSGHARATELLSASPAAPPNSPITRRQPLATLLPAFVPGPLDLGAETSRESTPASGAWTPANPSTPTSTSSLPSLFVTPNPYTSAAAPPATPVPERQYGIRGVAVFYSSNAAARAAARRLGIDDPKIMVSDNDAKLEAWMTNRPFVGEEM